MTSLLPKNEALADVDTIQKLTQIAILGDGRLLNLHDSEKGCDVVCCGYVKYLSGGDGHIVNVVAGDGDLILVSGALNNATFLHCDAPSQLLPNEVTDLQDSVLASGTIGHVVVDGKMGIHELHLVLQAL
jgi:hypothetical protein